MIERGVTHVTPIMDHDWAIIDCHMAVSTLYFFFNSIFYSMQIRLMSIKKPGSTPFAHTGSKHTLKHVCGHTHTHTHAVTHFPWTHWQTHTAASVIIKAPP